MSVTEEQVEQFREMVKYELSPWLVWLGAWDWSSKMIANYLMRKVKRKLKRLN